MLDLGPAVETTLTRCLGVAPGEEVLVVVDPGTRPIGEALRDGARDLGAEATLFVMDERATHGTEPPRPVAAALAACDVYIAPTTKSLSHTVARKRATDAGARGATMPGVTAEMLARVMAGDFATMVARSRAVCTLLDAGAQARVTCPRGTDVTLELSGRSGLADDGVLTDAGAFGNLPAGEGFIAPLSGSGTIVASSLAGIGVSEDPVHLTMEDGQLVAAEPGAGAELLGQPRRTTAPELGPRPSRRQLAVHEHRQPELLAEQVAEHERLGAGGPALGRIEIHDRRHVDRADPGVDSFMAGEIDPPDDLGGAAQHRAGQVPGRTREREHAAMVVGVSVDAEQTRVECGADRLDRRPVAALRDVRDRQEDGVHSATSARARSDRFRAPDARRPRDWRRG